MIQRQRPVFRHLITGALLVCAATAAGAKEIALTFDDAPRPDTVCLSGEARTKRLLQQLEHLDVPAMFMVTTRNVEQSGDQRLRAYTKAGHLLGNHSHSHRHPEDLGAEAYLADVQKAHEILRELPAYHPFYRFPFLNEGRDIPMRDTLRQGLEAIGLHQAYVTVDNYDWYIDHLLQQALARDLAQDQAIDGDKLGELYVREMVASIEFYDNIARQHLGRSPRHVLLLHENDAAALYLDRLITALRDQGWTFISPLTAYQDPIAQPLPDTVFNNQGRVVALAHLNGASKRTLFPENEEESYLEQVFRVEALRLASDSDATASAGRRLRVLCGH